MSFGLPVLVSFVGMLVSSFCGMKLWNWFLPVAFPSVPPLGYGLAVGIGLIVMCFFPLPPQDFQKFLEQDSEEVGLDTIWSSIINGIAGPIISLGIGWIVQGMTF